jgi:hypothetical protein
MNSASQEYLCQLGLRLSCSGASLLKIYPSAFVTVDGWFHTSALARMKMANPTTGQRTRSVWPIYFTLTL